MTTVKKAVILGSKGDNGIETSVANMDLMADIAVQEGWSTAVCTSLEFYAIDDIEISINGRTSFILKAGDEIEERNDLIDSLVIVSDGMRYRYYAKF